LNIGTPSLSGADPTEEIDVVDYTLTSNGTYTFSGPNGDDIQFSTAIPAGGWYSVTVEFADGTQLSSSFTL